MTKEQALEYFFDYKEFDYRTRDRIFDAMDKFADSKTKALTDALQKILDICDAGIYDITDSAFINHIAKEAIKNNNP